MTIMKETSNCIAPNKDMTANSQGVARVTKQAENTNTAYEESAQSEGDSTADNKNQMLTAPVFKLFIKMAMPIIIGLMINGLYNFVDAIFIARAVGTQAIGGVSAAFPVHMLLISFGAMMSSGMASMLSRQLGAQHYHQANAIFTSTLFFALVMGILSSILLIIFKEDIFGWMKLPLVLRSYAIDYIVPIALFSGLSFCSGVVSDAFRAEGKTVLMMKVMLISSVLNVIFDAMFLFVFEWGVAGAAWATVSAIAISFAYSVRKLVTSEHQIRFEKKEFNWQWQYNRRALGLGMPIFLSYTGYAVMLASVNFAIASVAEQNTDLLISAHGIFNRTFMLIFLPILGMMIAFQTFAGFNYGAREYQRVVQVLKVAMLTCSSYALCWTTFMLFNSQWLFQLFTSDQALIAAASEISDIVLLGFVTVSIGMICPALFQALGFAKPAVILNAFRTYLLLLPVLWAFSVNFGVSGIWWTFPAIDAIASVIVAFYTYRFVKKVLLNPAKELA